MLCGGRLLWRLGHLPLVAPVVRSSGRPPHIAPVEKVATHFFYPNAHVRMFACTNLNKKTPQRSQVVLPRQALDKEEQGGTMFSLMSISMLPPFGYQQIDCQILCETIDLRQWKTSIRTFNIVLDMAIAHIC